MALDLKAPKSRAEWVCGQPMAPCPKCGSYDMGPQIPIAMETTGDESIPQLVGKWARATKAGATPLQGPAYYACRACLQQGAGSGLHGPNERGVPGRPCAQRRDEEALEHAGRHQ